jgi:hypothetical protein
MKFFDFIIYYKILVIFIYFYINKMIPLVLDYKNVIHKNISRLNNFFDIFLIKNDHSNNPDNSNHSNHSNNSNNPDKSNVYDICICVCPIFLYEKLDSVKSIRLLNDRQFLNEIYTTVRGEYDPDSNIVEIYGKVDEKYVNTILQGIYENFPNGVNVMMNDQLISSVMVESILRLMIYHLDFDNIHNNTNDNINKNINITNTNIRDIIHQDTITTLKMLMLSCNTINKNRTITQKEVSGELLLRHGKLIIVTINHTDHINHTYNTDHTYNTYNTDHTDHTYNTYNTDHTYNTYNTDHTDHTNQNINSNDNPINNQTTCLKYGSEQSAPLIDSEYSFHTHPINISKKINFKYGWPSASDFKCFLYTEKCKIHLISSIEGLYILYDKCTYPTNVNNINNNIKPPPEKFIYKHMNISKTNKNKHITPRMFISIINSVRFNNNRVLSVDIIEW